MEKIYQFYTWADPILIYPFRLTENPFAGFMIGTIMLVVLCICLGQIGLKIAERISGRHANEFKQKAVRMHNLSIRAILIKDKKSYTACNSEANDAFGRYFFAQTALGASALWAIPFALGWMSTRFEGIGFKIAGFDSYRIGYAGIFILLYILIRIGLSELFYWVSNPQNTKSSEEQMITWSDIEASGGYPTSK